MPAALMLQGTGSDVGKSLLVAGLARALTRRGLRVRPFKPQNMSNNAAVTADGGEIGRAQALQARACAVAPTRDMNPVLLKPQSEVGAQLVVCGEVRGNADARTYQSMKRALLGEVLASFERLSAHADVVLVEGAGSPAELNLRAGDIANMGFALATATPVVLVGDIDRGGVIASLYGTAALLDDAERALLRALLVNKFRGDLSLFDAGRAILAERTGVPCLGVVPWFSRAAELPAEDAASLPGAGSDAPRAARTVVVAVPVISRIANFDDLDPLRAEPGVQVRFVAPGEALPGDAALVVLPGSKSTRADLAFLRAQGWDVDLAAHLRRGGRVIGICGGYQMLGRTVRDPHGIEGPAGESQGLGLLEVDTTLGAGKRLEAVEGRDLASGEAVAGYRMHVGRTEGPGLTRPMLDLAGVHDGAVSADGRVAGCYLHGLFASGGYRRALLAGIGVAGTGLAHDGLVDAALDALATHLEAHVDVPALAALAGIDARASTSTPAASRPVAVT